MAGFDSDVEGLENLILRDQLFIICDKPLQTFLKKGKLFLDQMEKLLKIISKHTQAINLQILQRAVCLILNIKHRTRNTRTVPRHETYKYIMYTYCGLNNHKSGNCRKKNWNKQTNNTRPISCYRCGETGHKSYDCKASKRGQTQQAAAMQVLEPSIPTIQQTKHNVCNENHKWTRFN